MKMKHTKMQGVSVWGVEFVPNQTYSRTYTRRIIFDLGEHSFAFEWKRVKNGN
jgi:hypothetical protein